MHDRRSGRHSKADVDASLGGSTEFAFHDLSMDRSKLEAFGPGGKIDLTLGELRLVCALIEARGLPLSHELLAERLMAREPGTAQHALEQLVSRVRTKLHGKVAVTVVAEYGIGWKLVRVARRPQV